MASLSETEDESITTVESLIDSVETPSWSSSAQTASLTNTLTALTLAGVPVAHTTLDNVLKSLRNVVTVTTASLGADVEISLQPRNSRPLLVDRPTEQNTFEVRFLENAPLNEKCNSKQSYFQFTQVQ